MEHKHWSMQWVRWADSAVDYLAAAVGGDNIALHQLTTVGTTHSFGATRQLLTLHCVCCALCVNLSVSLTLPWV